jgi:hypothetical protein
VLCAVGEIGDTAVVAAEDGCQPCPVDDTKAKPSSKKASGVCHRQAFPLGTRTRCHPRPPARRPPGASDLSPGQPARTSARPSSCLLRRGSRVTKTVATERDSPASLGITTSHRVRGNPSILLTGHHGTARHSQLPKLDVAGSIPVARSILTGGYGTARSPLRPSGNQMVTAASRHRGLRRLSRARASASPSRRVRFGTYLW